jgi:hypothetical protein
MEGFTLSLALVDAVPVLLFGASMIMIGTRFGHPLFIIGAALSFLAGCCKVAWKLILGTSKKDVKWLNKCFVPLQSAGFLLMIISFILGFNRINWSGVLSAVTGIPAVLLFVLWILAMCAMVWYRKNRFRNDDAKSNWTAQIINCVAQAALLLGILLAN